MSEAKARRTRRQRLRAAILKQVGDEMQSSLSDARAPEESAIKVYEELVAAKTQEVNALTKQIETKTQRGGERAVANAQMANDIEDSKEGLAQDKEFRAELEKSCGSKGKEWDAEWEDRVTSLEVKCGSALSREDLDEFENKISHVVPYLVDAKIHIQEKRILADMQVCLEKALAKGITELGMAVAVRFQDVEARLEDVQVRGWR